MLRDDLKPYIDALKRREITGREVARLLGTHESYISRVLARMNITRDPPAKPLTDKIINQARAEHRLLCAQTMEPKAAAKAANCSLRTIYRLRGKT
jgi:IS30 family transposase